MLINGTQLNKLIMLCKYFHVCKVINSDNDSNLPSYDQIIRLASRLMLINKIDHLGKQKIPIKNLFRCFKALANTNCQFINNFEYKISHFLLQFMQLKSPIFRHCISFLLGQSGLIGSRPRQTQKGIFALLVGLIKSRLH